MWSIGISIIVLIIVTLSWNTAEMSDQGFKTCMAMKYHCYPPFTIMRDKVLDPVRNIIVSEKRRINLRRVFDLP